MSRWKLMRTSTLDRLILEAERAGRERERTYMIETLRMFLKGGKNVYLETVTLGENSSVTDSLFLGCDVGVQVIPREADNESIDEEVDDDE